MLRFRFFPTVLAAALFALPLSASAGGDVAAGKEKSASCAACHGEKGMSSMAAVPGMVVPNLAGQHADYLAKTLSDYRSGARQNPTMNGLATALSDQDIADLAAYFASLDGLQVVKPQ